MQKSSLWYENASRVIQTVTLTHRQQNARFSKGDYVHMSLIENGARIKGVFIVRRLKYNAGGWVDYELTEALTGKSYKHGAGVRENLLKAGK